MGNLDGEENCLGNPDGEENCLGLLKEKLAACISLVAKMSAIDRLAVRSEPGARGK